MARIGASGIVERVLAAPRRWPVRWRLAAVSAALTLIILLGFAAVVGQLTSDKLKNDFREDLQETANQLAFDIQDKVAGGPGAPGDLRVPSVETVPTADESAVRVVTESGQRIWPTESTPDLGIPRREVRAVGSYHGAAGPLPPST